MKHSISFALLACTLVLSSFAVGCRSAGSTAAHGDDSNSSSITRAEIEAAQRAWGDGLVAIGQASASGGDPRPVAQRIIRDLYAYETTPVLFKPTLTSGAQTFRNDAAGALAYFVGSDKNYPQDKGFALKPWKRVRFENAAIFVRGDVALSQGNVWVTGADGQDVMVDKSFGYMRGPDGRLRIVLHHSSLPYAANG